MPMNNASLGLREKVGPDGKVTRDPPVIKPSYTVLTVKKGTNVLIYITAYSNTNM